MKWLTPLITALGFTVVVFVLVDRLPKVPAPSSTAPDSLAEQRETNRGQYLIRKRIELGRTVGSPEFELRTQLDELIRQQTRDAIDYAKDHPATRP